MSYNFCKRSNFPAHPHPTFYLCISCHGSLDDSMSDPLSSCPPQPLRPVTRLTGNLVKRVAVRNASSTRFFLVCTEPPFYLSLHSAASTLCTYSFAGSSQSRQSVQGRKVGRRCPPPLGGIKGLWAWTP